MIGTVVYSYHDRLGDEVAATICCGLDNPKAKKHWL